MRKLHITVLCFLIGDSAEMYEGGDKKQEIKLQWPNKGWFISSL